MRKIFIGAPVLLAICMAPWFVQPAVAVDPVTTLVSSTTPVDGGTFNQATVSCPAGMVVTGGGVDIAGTDPGGAGSALKERYSGPVFSGTGWTLGMDNTGTVQRSFTVIAICVTGTVSP